MVFVQVGPGRWVNVALAEEVKVPSPVGVEPATELEIIYASGRSRNLAGEEAAALRRFLVEYGRRIDPGPPAGPGDDSGSVAGGAALVEDSESGTVVIPSAPDRRKNPG